MDNEMATANAWAFLRLIDARYTGDRLEDIGPERMEHVRTLAEMLANTSRKAAVGALGWAMDRAARIIHAEAVRLEKGGECPW